MAAKKSKIASSGTKLVIVESPTKARTIKKFLGDGFIIESCMGHIRDLPQSAKDIPEKYKKFKWSNLGVNVDDNFDPIYCIPKNKTKVVKELKQKMAEADELVLATDEDREGESISWHLLEVLKPKIPVKRMVFHEITKSAIEKALSDFRDVDENLVKAQEARRILDRLVGYTISPLIWKKVAYGLSAGRVQSVAVRLIAEREHERLRFVKSQYWGVTGMLDKSGTSFESKLQTYQGKRLATGKDFDSETGKLLKDKQDNTLWLDSKLANEITSKLEKQSWTVNEVEEKPVSRKPAPPFITSTLQQEANRKLGMSSRETMSVAQKLYERGFITYMRTDSTNLSTQAIEAARSAIKSLYGKDYLPASVRDYTKKKSKGAQEAHEAIRPAGTEFVLPEETGLTGGMFKLYDLIWKRTVACQMVDAQQKQLSVKIQAGEAVFSANGMTIVFPGFLKAYVEGKDDPEAALEDREVKLPPLKKGETLVCKKLQPTEHETKPPARFTEASLVQKMEKEGIGRPSTYASIISTIQDRGYAKKIGNALAPSFTALVVTKLLSQHLPDYVDLNFTSQMEDRLDDIAQGDLDNIKYLDSVYHGKQGLLEKVEKQEEQIDPEESRQVELEGLKGLSFRVGRYGAYVCRDDKEQGKEVCASIPESYNPGDMTAEMAHKLIDQKISGNDALGKDPETQKPIYVLTGRYGPYVQLGDIDDEEFKPKRMALPAGLEPEDVTLEKALKLLSLPKEVGKHPETDKAIKVGLGRFGPYVVHDGDFRSIPKGTDLFDVDYDQAMELLSQPKKGRGGKSVVQDFGEHPELKVPIQVMTGRYGPYVSAGKKNLSLPNETDPAKITKEEVMAIVEEKKDEIASGKKKTKKKKSKAKAKTKTKAKAKTKTKSKTKKKAKKAAKKTKTESKAASKKIIRRSPKSS